LAPSNAAARGDQPNGSAAGSPCSSSPVNATTAAARAPPGIASDGAAAVPAPPRAWTPSLHDGPAQRTREKRHVSKYLSLMAAHFDTFRS
jgi:hypothetical protein